MAPEQLTGFRKFFIDLRNIVTDTQRFVSYFIQRSHIQILLVGILETDAHPLHLLVCWRSYDISCIRPGKQTIQFLWNIFLKKFTDEESQRFRIPQKVFAGRFLLSVQNGIGGQSEGMQSVLLRYRKPHFGRYKTNSCGKIGHLQTTVVHM